MIKKYKKDDTIVEAMLLEHTKQSFIDAYRWLENNIDFVGATDGTFINIKTTSPLAISIQARIDNYIVKDIEGNFYVYAREHFNKTFKKVHERNN